MHGGDTYTAKPFTHANYYNYHRLASLGMISPGPSCSVSGLSALDDCEEETGS